jgi:N-acetylglucosamine-6-phosphate deacetylase
MLALEHAEILTPQGLLKDGTVLIEEGRIRAVGPTAGLDVPRGTDHRDLRGRLIMPGYIDCHTHGGFGHDFMDCSPAEARNMLSRFAQHGVTGVLATIATCPQERCIEILRTLAPLAAEQGSGARLLGVHLEGPYISRERAGAQPTGPIRPPNVEEAAELLDASQGTVRLMTVAPEEPNGLELIRYLDQAGVVVGIGHSNADYETAMMAIDAGVTRATHTFNGMSPFHHRRPGIPGAVMTDDRVYCEIIADGHHVHPAVVDLLVKVKGHDHVILVSDSNQAAGMGDGTYVRPGDRKITVRDGAAWLANGSLAGSVLTLDSAVAWLVNDLGHPLASVVAMASRTPAASLGLAPDRGAIQPGALADLAVLDRDLDVLATLVAGAVAFQAEDRLISESATHPTSSSA